MRHQLDDTALKQWFLAHRRLLPWRQQPTPYAVWVSEVMLQQTQVAVVIPYFERWMERFPTIEALAKASLDEVIKLWEGLGYYSRARNLHSGAQYVLAHFSGVVPSVEEDLRKIKGLGPYTVGAIRAFAFKQKAAAVDGNVLRVLARFFNIHDPINSTTTIRTLRSLANEVLPNDEPWLVAEGLIELGATVCRRQPMCELCPLQKGCQAYAQGIQAQLPKKEGKVSIERLFRSVAVIKSQQGLLLRKCEKGEIMSDLHEFPYLDTTEQSLHHHAWKEALPLALEWECSLSPIQQTFTRYRVRLDPVVFTCDQPHNIPGYQWKGWDELARLAFSSGHRRILQTLLAGVA